MSTLIWFIYRPAEVFRCASSRTEVPWSYLGNDVRFVEASDGDPREEGSGVPTPASTTGLLGKTVLQWGASDLKTRFENH